MTQQVRASSDPIVGSVLLGRYRVVRELAKGGMGVVYLARAEGAVGFVKPVVIKLLLPEHAQDERFVAMFVREATILAQLRHPSLVDVIEFGEHDGAYVLVMEYVRGYHLGQWLRFLAIKKRKAPPAILIQITIDILMALHHAHELTHPDGTSMQIVHRDVSPSNILLDEDGRARLLDFGVARMRGGVHDYKTQVQGFMGKMPYTAPEMFSNIEASPKSDLYACGVVLHEALFGRNVFRTEAQAATLHKVMNHVPELVEAGNPEIPAGLDVALGRALMKTPADRHADAREFALALRKLQREQESDVRAQLATLLKSDFGEEMAEKLNLESLAHRDEAWRRLSIVPDRPGSTMRKTGERSVPGLLTSGEISRPGGDKLPAAPAAAGATVAHSPAARRNTPGYLNAPDPAAIEAAVAQAKATQRGDETIARGPTDRANRAPANTNARLAPPPPPPPQHAAAAARSSGTPRGVWIGMGVVGLLALAAIVLPLLRTAPPPAAPEAPIRVVSTPSQPEVVDPAPEAPEPAPAVDEPAGATKRDGDTAKRKAKGADAQGLTQALRRQQTKLEGCFQQHSVTLSGNPTTQLEFDVEASGRITRVGLTPRSLASTPLGECLISVGQKTRFPAQPSAVSFAIPLTARRGP